MRNAFVQTMIELAEKDPSVVLLMAEVGFSVVEPFEAKFPDRFVNTGICEQNLVLAGAGMAVSGMHPVCYSMSSFLPSRAFEIIKDSVCYQNLPVVLVSIGSGLTYGEMGSTHHAIEESALMRALPNMTVLFPADANEVRGALSYAFSEKRPFYISIPKAPAPENPLPHDFVPGKAACYRKGQDGAILAMGYSVHEAMKAAALLEAEGISLSVYGFSTVKPLDVETIVEACETKNIFVLDEHQSCAGMGAEVAKVVLEKGVSLQNFHDFSIPDTFCDTVLRYQEMLSEYGIKIGRAHV